MGSTPSVLVWLSDNSLGLRSGNDEGVITFSIRCHVDIADHYCGNMGYNQGIRVKHLITIIVMRHGSVTACHSIGIDSSAITLYSKLLNTERTQQSPKLPKRWAFLVIKYTI